MKKTRLHSIHEKLDANMAEFGGYMMPIQYSGIIKEHQACRKEAAIFDTDHMGSFIITGPDALADLENLISCDVATMTTGQCRYGMMCNEAGAVLDDLLVYRLGDEEFMLVVNAGTKDKDFTWIKDHLSDGTDIKNNSELTAKIDVQGPKSPKIIQQLLTKSIDGLKYYRFMHNEYRDTDVIVSRTGYTGEIGFELYLNHDLALVFWQDCMDLGAVPAGLGARDTLRLEMGMPLYGHELDELRNAGESGFNRSISEKKDFIGSSVINDISLRESKLVGIEVSGRRPVRHGDELLDVSGNRVGVVTSGSFSPSLGYPVALGYVSLASVALGTELKIKSPRYELDGKVVSTPFYGTATGKRPVKDFL
jgi:aminomethyltransferase